jgi:capsular exopolysaccharide synthesis family protein
MEDHLSPGAVSPLDYLRPVWRFKWIALLIVIVAAGGAYAYYAHKPKTYESSTQLYVGQSDIDQLLTTQAANPGNSQRDLANQARLVTTPDVAAAVIRRLRLSRTTDDVLASVTVRPDAVADFLTIATTAHAPREAANLADTFAAEYLAIRRRNTQRQARSQLARARQQLDRTARSNDVARDAIRDRIATLQGTAEDPPQVGSQLSAANVPTSAIAPRPLRNAVFAAAIALLVAILLAYVFDRSDGRIRSVKDFEDLLDIRILAAVPEVKSPTPGHGNRSGIVAALREPVHTLRVNLDLVRAQRGAHSVMISSALPAEGKSTLLRNLALAYRDAGLRVAVVEGDMRRPTMAGLFDLARTPGLAEVLRGDVDLQDAMSKVEEVHDVDGVRAPDTKHGTLDVLVGGFGGENAGLLLYPAALAQMFNTLRETHDVVLCDAPPVLLVSDALVIAPLVDMVVLVVRAGVSTDRGSEHLVRTFEAASEVDVAGAIVNAVPPGAVYAGYGGYYGATSPDAPGKQGRPAVPANAAAPTDNPVR